MSRGAVSAGREVLVGFDSAWTDNARNPGAIAACVLEQRRCVALHPPRLASFAQAASFVSAVSEGAALLLVAIDQPTIVPNEAGSRPVDRVAASLVSRLGGGVQPARRGGMGARMFGDAAPVWAFLDALGAVHDPLAARSAVSGRFVMEVFPALALPSMVPAFWERRRAAKYNPAASRFVAADWPLVAAGVAVFAHGLGAEALAEWAASAAHLERPRKADQDRLDAAICVAIALAWRHGPADETLQLGDAQDGLMATIASAPMRAVLLAAAKARGVSVDGRASEGATDPAPAPDTAAAGTAAITRRIAKTGATGRPCLTDRRA